jgi:hypothetical protein
MRGHSLRVSFFNHQFAGDVVSNDVVTDPVNGRPDPAIEEIVV